MKFEVAFNVKKYIIAQNKQIKERVKKFKNLFVEIGGFISNILGFIILSILSQILL